MRAVSHCANHPSREAVHRCSACATWVCDLCTLTRADRTFCSRRCVWQHRLRTALGRARGLLMLDIPAAWAIGLTTAASLVAATTLGVLIGTLLELSGPSDSPTIRVAVPVVPAAPVARVAVGDDGWRVVLDGTPGASVAIAVGDAAIIVVQLDENGHAEVDFPDYPGGDGGLRLAVLGGPMQLVSALPTATPTPAPTDTATPAARPTSTDRATSISTPAARPSATPTASESPTPSPPRRTRTENATQLPAAASPVAAAAADHATSIRPPPVLHLVPDAGPRLALTFDGASSASRTTDLLDVLRSLGVSVTIFVTGEFVDANPGIVRRAALAGHEFGNHTYSHPHLTSYATNRRHDLLPDVTRERLHEELRRTEEAFRRATGRSLAPFWRAPYGEENRQLRAWAMEIGYLHVRWSSLEGRSLDSLDWVEDEHSPLYVDSRRLVERLLGFPRLEGGIVLMHLSTNRPEPPWSELPHFAAEVRARRMEIGTVSELLQASPTWRPWYQRAAERHREEFEGSADR